MSDRRASHIWWLRGLYVMLCLTVIFVNILPLSTMPTVWAGPDLLFALSYAWATRRPDAVPLIAVAGMLLLSDLIFYRPPGLWAFWVVMAITSAKIRTQDAVETSFLSDYLSFVVSLIVISAAYRLSLVVFFVERPPFGLITTHVISTALAYPAVVALSYYLFGIRRRSQDRMGRKGLI